VDSYALAYRDHARADGAAVLRMASLGERATIPGPVGTAPVAQGQD